MLGKELTPPRLCSPLLSSLFLLLPPLPPTRGLALLSPIAPECFRVKPHLHCGIRIHKGWINCTPVISSSTMIKIYIPIFPGILVQGWGGLVS